LQIDLEDLRQHYASLTDEELLAFDRDALVEAARQCFDQELARRGLTREKATDPLEDWGSGNGAAFDPDAEPDWLESAACACSYVSHPGNDAAADADNARDVLQSAGLPCRIVVEEEPKGDSTKQVVYRVMVPGALNLEATSVLDQELFNPELEADWRAHFAVLSDEDLSAINLNSVCAGLEDRINRLKRAYREEIERRKG
jgi:hypothetical protein